MEPPEGVNDVAVVLNGDLNELIRAYLLFRKAGNRAHLGCSNASPNL